MPTYPGSQPGGGPQPWMPPRVQPAQQPQVKPQGQLAVGDSPGAKLQPVQPIVARGKPYEDPPAPPIQPLNKNNAKSAPLTLPSPQELGVPATERPAAKVDWNATHERLEQLGGTGFQTARLSDGRFRVGFVLRTNQADQVHHIEATAATQAEAVAAALRHAEQWASGQP